MSSIKDKTVPILARVKMTSNGQQMLDLKPEIIEEISSLHKTFEYYVAAHKNAIELFKGANPDRPDDNWPDTVELTAFLMNRIKELEEQIESA